jgi:hypothetical protein
MWQDLLLHCVVFTKTSEEFAPLYLAEIRHDMRQTTVGLVEKASRYRCSFLKPLASLEKWMVFARFHPSG